MTTTPRPIAESFVAEILSPYRPNARYLKSATLTGIKNKAQPDEDDHLALMSGTGLFAIPESCYIDDTGHFNAVEFNICYNQLAYVLFGKCVNDGLLQGLRIGRVSVPSFPEFKRHQLPAMLIVSIEGVRFFKQLKSEAFEGHFSLNRVASVRTAWFFFTSISFADAEGVKAKGSVVLAFDPSFSLN